MLLPAFGRCDPGPQFPWRTMPYMPRVPAGKVRNPVALLILVETNNDSRLARCNHFFRHLPLSEPRWSRSCIPRMDL
jgi:hypothetical protein